MRNENAEQVLQANHDVVIVGAGFAGMYMLHRLRSLGLKVRVFERGTDVGGTWYWNRYPGARCDVESMQYSYSFSEELQQEWKWTERYAAQPEILAYARHVADRFNLRPDIQFETSVVSMSFDEECNRWTVTLDSGQDITAGFVVMATGSLSNARTPDLIGLSSFEGKTYHTGQWPHDGVDFSGLRVGVIGTGSSAIQAIPIIAGEARHLTVFQRTPNFSIPAHNHSLSDEKAKDWKVNYSELRRRAREESRNGLVFDFPTKSALEDTEADRSKHYEARWAIGGTIFTASYNDLAINKASNDTAAEFVRSKIREIVKDPDVAKLLQPTTYPIGTKRICVDTNYYETFNRDNVTLVDIRNAPIERITPRGLITGGKEYEFDAIVFATGFDAMTGSFAKVDIRGREGMTLKQKWAEGPKTYLGLMVAGFPNLFFVTGPGSPSVLSNMVVSIEQHVDWIADCLVQLSQRGVESIEATERSESDWVAHVNEVASKTLYPEANSWYMGANVPGKPRVFMPYIGGVNMYRLKCREVANRGYEGFELRTIAGTSQSRRAVKKG
ncbi:NAD(P)/FAD-dependent oxidoreductase [Bradyrhizobium sp. LHD-71]|nr:NAD(P)/FAD-dependent oxidoreductase [Bradyrhizobium sp. LHD-71]MDQ8731962.1 NAD(P)/FAD-dependent oxidoreductase [Bradyrhizobium sp. LHD-71]